MKRSNAERAVEFLRGLLADGEMPTAELEKEARAAGLLAEEMRIGDSKTFRAAKRSLGITSRRSGFGPGGGWCWQLPTCAETAHPSCGEPAEVINGGLHSRPSQEAAAKPTRSAPQSAASARPVPPEWVRGVALLRGQTAPSGVGQYRWKVFVDDCVRFLAGPLAERAVELGWDAESLFGYRFERPIEHLGTAGLLWNVAGGQLAQLFRDAAVIIASNGRQQTFKRRPHLTGTSLPWKVASSKREGVG